MADRGVSLVNQLTAECYSPQELVDCMRDLERTIGRLDDTCAALSANLKAAKKDRDRAVADLRSVIREVKILDQKTRRKSAK